MCIGIHSRFSGLKNGDQLAAFPNDAFGCTKPAMLHQVGQGLRFQKDRQTGQKIIPNVVGVKYALTPFVASLDQGDECR